MHRGFYKNPQVLETCVGDRDALTRDGQVRIEMGT